MKKNTCVKHFLKLTKILVIKQQKKKKTFYYRRLQKSKFHDLKFEKYSFFYELRA